MNWSDHILCYRDTDSYPEDIEFLMETPGVLTLHGGTISHMAVACRGLGKPCILVEEVDLQRILASGEVEMFGEEGVVLTGQLVSTARGESGKQGPSPVN